MNIFDGHNDTLNRKYSSHPVTGYDFLIDNTDAHIDMPKARKGGLAGGMFAIFTEGDSPTQQQAEDTANNILVDITEIEQRSNGRFKLCKSSSEIQTAIDNNIFAATLHFEGAEPIKADLSNLEYWYEQGLRSIGLTWSRPNVFADGVGFTFGQLPDVGNGLTAAGKALVQQCNKLGILVDMAHLSAAGVKDVLAISDKPVAVTHGNVWQLCNSPRNLTDDQLKAIAANDGVIGINFHKGFLSPTGDSDSDIELQTVVSHFRYIADLIGVRHLAIGSDFDGAFMPDCLSNASKLPDLISALKSTGFSDNELEQIAYKNWLRIFPD